MLDPHDRTLLREALRPPEGYSLDRAIGTTFSLDLLTLLTAPLAFTIFDSEDEDGRPTIDPLAMLQALRRYADRITIFCQAGQISIPRQQQPLYGYLEDSVIEVAAPDPKRVFHPKLWVLRYSGDEDAVHYRVICMTRNLTFDRSWDSLLVLDGPLTDRKRAFAGLHPLGDFIAQLPTLAVGPVSDSVKADIELMQSQIRRADLEVPEPFHEMFFHPLGIDGYKGNPLDDRTDRAMVLSPFLSPGFLMEVTREGEEHVLISRLESLGEIAARALKRFARVHVLSAAAQTDEEGDSTLTGLHAKLFVVERGWDAHVYTGSANATNAAFRGNVEFLVELVGKKSKCGIDVFLTPGDGQAGFVDLLQDFVPSGEKDAPDAEQAKLEAKAEEIRLALATSALVARVAGEDEYRIGLRHSSGSPLNVRSGVTVTCWPITLPESAAVNYRGDQDIVAEFGPLSSRSLTTFFAFHVAVKRGDKTASARFVLNLPLEGAPEGRRERILNALLENRDQLMRFLMLLLASEGVEARGILDAAADAAGGKGDSSAAMFGLPLFESLLRAFDREPGKLREVARLVEDLKKTPEGRGLLPEGFDQVWEPISEAWRGKKS